MCGYRIGEAKLYKYRCFCCFFQQLNQLCKFVSLLIHFGSACLLFLGILACVWAWSTRNSRSWFFCALTVWCIRRLPILSHIHVLCFFTGSSDVPGVVRRSSRGKSEFHSLTFYIRWFNLKIIRVGSFDSSASSSEKLWRTYCICYVAAQTSTYLLHCITYLSW